MQLMQLPKIELFQFDGDPLTFQEWLLSFEMTIKAVTKKLCYLRQYTVGEPHDLVSGFIYNPTKESYVLAKWELINTCGDSAVISNGLYW